MPAVEKGIQDARTRGYLAGYPMVDFRVTVFDGSYHDVDSNELSFKLAGSLAFKDAMTRARPTILEPVMNVEVYAPSDFAGDLMGDLNGRRGRIAGMDTRGATTIIKAQVPMSEMLTYEQHLTSATGGRGSYHMEYSHYDEVPAHLQTKIIAAAKAERGGRRSRRSLTVDKSSEVGKYKKARGGSSVAGSSARPFDRLLNCLASSPALARRRRLAFAALAAGFARLLARAAVVVLLAAQALGRRAQPPADALGLRLGGLGLRASAFGLRARVELAADQLDLRDLGAVAPAEAEAQQARVAARPRRRTAARSCRTAW